jgi:hypothetical protein
MTDLARLGKVVNTLVVVASGNLDQFGRHSLTPYCEIASYSQSSLFEYGILSSQIWADES